MSSSAPRLIITTHADDGTSTFLSDEAVEVFHPFGPTATGFGLLHSSDTVPIANTTRPQNLTKQIPRCPPQGVMFVTSDFPADYSAPTQSWRLALIDSEGSPAIQSYEPQIEPIGSSTIG